jgi:hypothetical protein
MPSPEELAVESARAQGLPERVGERSVLERVASIVAGARRRQEREEAA